MATGVDALVFDARARIGGGFYRQGLGQAWVAELEDTGVGDSEVALLWVALAKGCWQGKLAFKTPRDFVLGIAGDVVVSTRR
eukprot:486159-Pelagomonas_calceolata.AAC.1